MERVSLSCLRMGILAMTEAQGRPANKNPPRSEGRRRGGDTGSRNAKFLEEEIIFVMLSPNPNPTPNPGPRIFGLVHNPLRQITASLSREPVATCRSRGKLRLQRLTLTFTNHAGTRRQSGLNISAIMTA